MNNLVCPGCHDGSLPDFDHYCDANDITTTEAPLALAAFLSLVTGSDVTMEKVS